MRKPTPTMRRLSAWRALTCELVAAATDTGDELAEIDGRAVDGVIREARTLARLLERRRALQGSEASREPD